MFNDSFHDLTIGSGKFFRSLDFILKKKFENGYCFNGVIEVEGFFGEFWFK